jgi:hypothetical protein
VQQAWEMGEVRLTLIHGHGRNRGISPGFVNTNTGYFGLCIRRALRHDESLREWIFRTTLDCGQMGCTSVERIGHFKEWPTHRGKPCSYERSRPMASLYTKRFFGSCHLFCFEPLQRPSDSDAARES